MNKNIRTIERYFLLAHGIRTRLILIKKILDHTPIYAIEYIYEIITKIDPLEHEKY